MNTSATPLDSVFYLVVPIAAMGVGLAYLVLNIVATRKVIVKFRGAAVPVWVLVIWMLPVIGFLSAFAALNQPGASDQ